jgi:hypothetical protein
MPECESRTHVAEVVRNEVLPGHVDELSQRVLALWAPLAQKHFEVRLHAVSVGGMDLALEDAFPLGCKVLLTETADRVIRLKPLVSSQQVDL